MRQTSRSNLHMVYTPRIGIPIGEAIRLPNGTHALRVKNPRTNAVDDIPLDTLCEAVIYQARSQEDAGTRSQQRPASQGNNTLD